jgi:multidrug resistance protein, MATE family
VTVPSNIAHLNWQALLAIFTLTLSVFPELYDLTMLANYGDTSVVAGAGLGVMFINMFVYGTFEGMNGAIDTLVSQYYGIKDYESCNRIYNKARIINTVFFLPIAVILALSDKILIFLDQDPVAASVTQKFLVYQIPGLYAITMYDTLRRFLQAQGSFDIPVKGLIVTNVFHIVTLYFVLKYINFDPVIMTASVTNISMILDFFILKYLANENLKKTNFLGIFDGAFDDWWEYLELALPSMFIICAEWWMYEVLAIFAGLLGVEYLSVVVIIFNTHNFVYDISYGLSQAASSLIGRTLAESGKFEAKKLLMSICFIQLILCVIMTIVYLTLARQIIGVFTSEETIIDLYLA